MFIIRNEYLPALEKDPGALARIGLKVGRNDDGSIRIYQPPGERNALGRIRFNFPNRFLVYQHDTPHKNLFEKTARAYSHGCMRVENPDQYAEVLLSLSQPEDGYNVKRIRMLYGGDERLHGDRLPRADAGRCSSKVFGVTSGPGLSGRYSRARACSRKRWPCSRGSARLATPSRRSRIRPSPVTRASCANIAKPMPSRSG